MCNHNIAECDTLTIIYKKVIFLIHLLIINKLFITNKYKYPSNFNINIKFARMQEKYTWLITVSSSVICIRAKGS